jgi:cytochrome P450
MTMFDQAILENPYPSYGKWQTEKPIWWDEDASRCIVTRYDDVRAVLKDAATFSSKAKGEGEQKAIALPLVSDDPPRHAELRAIVNRVFTSRALKETEAEVLELVDELLDEIKGENLIDISDTFTIPLPIRIFSRLMGYFMSLIAERRTNPDQIDTAIEEILRYDSRVHFVSRKAGDVVTVTRATTTPLVTAYISVLVHH